MMSDLNAKAADPLVQCENCLWVGKESQLIVDVLHPGNEYEPPDTVGTCPRDWCRLDTIRTLEDEEICESCNEDIKYTDSDGEEYDICYDCQIAGAEALFDAMMDR
jgi:hypothetical protein